MLIESWLESRGRMHQFMAVTNDPSTIQELAHQFDLDNKGDDQPASEGKET